MSNGQFSECDQGRSHVRLREERASHLRLGRDDGGWSVSELGCGLPMQHFKGLVGIVQVQQKGQAAWLEQHTRKICHIRHPQQMLQGFIGNRSTLCLHNTDIC